MLSASKSTKAAAVFLCAAAAVFLWSQDPAESPYCPPCPTNYATKLYCPGCGALRAMHALVHFRIAEAAGQNALLVLFLPVLVFGIFFPDIWRIRHASTAVLIAVILFTVMRNIPFFSFLAPH